VYFIKQRLVDGRLEDQNVHEQGGHRGATRLVYRPVGDHLEAMFQGTAIVARLIEPDGSRWTLHFAGDGMEFTDETSIAHGVLTVTSTDQTERGPEVTVVRFLPVGCDVVDSELANYP
jgi:hypothetical protein